MQSIVPYTKEIQFKSRIFEICSISLEHEINPSDSEITGNFIISGEYKSHEVSVNKEEFNYKLPFHLEVTDTIDKNSIQFEITDFNYQVVNEDTLKVDIEFQVSATTIEPVRIEEREAISEIKKEVIEDIDDLFHEEEIVSAPIEERIEVEEKEETPETIEERLEEEQAEVVLDSAIEKEDEYMTYHIHIVSETDTLESLIATYETDIDTLKEYNQMDSLNIGDKIIIPSKDE
ncbi:MAG: LysM peptidoglycan-binding domain-containing protein [Bacilli bacterium]|nr:LysM peptidoglycan-binding domain-containing protein [Bacilli bacterium]